MDDETLQIVERSLLRSKWDDRATGPLSSILDLTKLVVECRFRDVLLSEQTRSLIRPLTDETTQAFRDLVDISISSSIDPVEAELLYLITSIACLQAFVQANWTGPDLDVTPLDLLTDASDTSRERHEKFIHAKAVSELAYGGEPAYHLAKFPAFLRLSQLLVAYPFSHIQSAPWWRLRIASVHQRILDEPVALTEDLRASLEPLHSTFANDPDLAGRMYLELGLFEYYFSQDRIAAEYFVKAARSTGMEYELTGALGKRTKFQVTELSQLVLLAHGHLKDETESESPQPKDTRGSETNSRPSTTTIRLPETLALNDDTLLEQTEFTSSTPSGSGSRLSHINPSSQPPLHPIDQSILLSLCLNVRNTSPTHGLTSEQMAPYVERVISHPKNWSVHTMALLLRSRLESSRTRTVERSTFQLQALIEQMPTSDSSPSERLIYFHSIPLPSRWEMEKELAQRYLSLGVIKSALDIFKRLEMWEDVVKCYGALEKPEKGITIVRDLLEGRKEQVDTVISRGKYASTRQKDLQDTAREAKLWCLLGDLEAANASDHYQKAWQVSNSTSGRAMRSLGGYYFARAKYSEAVDCLTKAVKINPLLTRSWFILGCACMRLEKWEGGRDAFSRCVAIDEEDGESWNNLASMYLRIGARKTAPEVIGDSTELSSTKTEKVSTGETSLQIDGPSNTIPFEHKMLAFRALKQGLRYSYENWRMWYNYMIVSMDVGELQEACRALGRIVEQTGDKAGSLAVDEDVLDRLVDAVTRAPANPEDAIAEGDGAAQNSNEGHGLYKNVLSLFERTLLPRLSSPRIFRSYARLLSWQSQWEDAIKAYLDAYRCGSAGTIEKGEIDTEKWRDVVSEVEEIVDILRNFGPRVENYKWKLQARSIIRTFMGRSRDFEDKPEWERLTNLQEELRKGNDE